MWVVLTLWMLYPASPLLDAVKEQESSGRWLARNGSHIGAYQVSRRVSKAPWPLLYLEPIGRLEASRILGRFRRAAGGDTLLALEGYRHGYAGARGKTDGLYAKCVVTRVLLAQEGRKLPACKEEHIVYSAERLRRAAKEL